MDIINEAEKRKKELNLESLKKLGFWKEKESSGKVSRYPPYESYDTFKFNDLPETDPRFRNKEAVLYFHFPFCLKKCVFCRYYSVIEKTSTIKSKEYLAYVKKEIELFSQRADLKSFKIKSVYFGGGTPTYTSTEDLKDFILFIKEKFDIKPNVEFASESSPETIIGSEGEKRLGVMIDLGLNRLSIGVQDFDDRVLKLIARTHNSSTALKAVKTAKALGIKNINIDLIYGLPGQTKKTWEKTTNLVASLDTECVTADYLCIKPTSRGMFHNPSMYLLFKKKPGLFPSEDESFLFYLMINEMLKKSGFKQRQSTWFTKSEKLVSQYLVGRWQKLNDTLAFGVNVGSSVGNIEYQNIININEYTDTIKRGCMPFFRGKALTDDEMMQKKVIFGLKTALFKKDFKDKFGIEIRDKFGTVFDKLIKLGLCYETSERLGLTDLGDFISDEICHEFFSENINEQAIEYEKRLNSKLPDIKK